MKAIVALTQFQALPSDSVDKQAGVIKGVSVLTIGPALGHGIQIDQEGLNQCLEACNNRGSIKLIDKHDAEFEGIVGSVTNFRIEGDKVKGDAELFENHPMRNRIIEIATKIPTEFGLSIECDNAHIDNPNGEGKLFRCTNVDAVALVPRPAANKTGLFSAKQFDTPAKLNLIPMTNLKTALQNFAKLAKLEEGDTLDKVIDAIVEATTVDQPSIEDRLKKLEDGMKPVEMSDEEKEKLQAEEADKEKADEEKMAKLAEKVAEEKFTKFTQEIGLKRSPSAGGGFVVQDEKTKFESAISEQMSAGAKDRSTAIFRLAKDKPELYNEARKSGLI